MKRIQRLRAELASDLRTFASRLDELAQLGALAEPGPAAVAAVALHHAYGAIESALLRVARELGEGEPTVRSSALDLREPVRADLARFDVFLVDLAREHVPGA